MHEESWPPLLFPPNNNANFSEEFFFTTTEEIFVSPLLVSGEVPWGTSFTKSNDNQRRQSKDSWERKKLTALNQSVDLWDLKRDLF